MTRRDAWARCLEAEEADGFTAEPESLSPFEVVGGGTYDAETDTLVLVVDPKSETYLAVVEWNTHADGDPVEGEDGPWPECYYGPFPSEEAADEWVSGFIDGDTTVHAARVIPCNTLKTEEV